MHVAAKIILRQGWKVLQPLQSSFIIFLFSREGLAVPSLAGSSENAKSWQASRALSFPTNRTNTDECKISPSRPQ